MKKTIHTNSYKKLTEWLKKSREEKQLTMRQLAERINVHHPVIWAIENNERRIDVIEYIEYCIGLDIDPKIGIGIVQNELEK